MKSNPLKVDPRFSAQDQRRWQQVMQRDKRAEGKFVYSVRSTGIYCRPGCASRLPLPKHVRFHASALAAEQAGFRPCKRCRPQEETPAAHYASIIMACRELQKSQGELGLEQLAALVGMSPSAFHRQFKALVGITAKAFASAVRSDQLQRALSKSSKVTPAIFAAGFSAGSTFYASAKQTLGMTPTQFRRGGKGTKIRFVVGSCSLGEILVAATEVGVCCILLGDDAQELLQDLQQRFAQAELIGADKSFEKLVANAVGLIEQPSQGQQLPLDVRGTAFQKKVWNALCKIPVGKTLTYAELAERIGSPRAVRAVASACAANPLAVAIPCHRVIRSDGSLSGYRWGIERKAKLLDREKQLAEKR